MGSGKIAELKRNLHFQSVGRWGAGWSNLEIEAEVLPTHMLMKIALSIEWQIAIGAVLVVLVLALLTWLIFRHKPTAEEIERKRRTYLAVSGRIVDGMLLDFYEMEVEGGAPAHMLVYNYRISGVDYECSQDVTTLGELLQAHHVRAGFPCSVRYQPGNAQNSIVIAEAWSGLREGLPILPSYENPDALDLTARG
jgi:hypothetical protein